MEPRTILVVDSSKAMHRVYELALRQHRLVHANDGREALAVLKNRPEDVDLVLTTFNLEYLNGLELLAELRTRGSEAPTVVVISFEGQHDMVAEALDSGAAASVEHPFAPEQLNAVIAALPPRHFPSA